MKTQNEAFANRPEKMTDMDSWFLMGGPGLPVLSALLYLWFVLKLGPRFMSERKAFDLKGPLIVYNAVQIVFSSWWVYQALNDFKFIRTIYEKLCDPHCKTTPFEVRMKADTLGWYYMISKFVELLDTVFFVLRKKQEQISFLHVYHHFNMAVSTWACMKYARGPETLVIGVANSFVHVVMYTYYLLAALGPEIRKYLWWKKYITKLQIFLVVISYLGVLLMKPACYVKRYSTLFAILNTGSFLFLFSKYYQRSYVDKKSSNGDSHSVTKGKYVS